MRRFTPSLSALIAMAAAFLVLFTNATFFGNTTRALGSNWNWVHVASVGLFLYFALLLLLAMVCSQRTVKPVLVLLFMISAVTAYFMDSYHVIIDGDMVANAMATDGAETRDLLTPRLFAYVALLGILPSILIARLRVRRQSPGRSMLARVTLAGGALLGMAALVAASSAFYASFIREHKELRYYSNPVSPLYGLYRYTAPRVRGAPEPLRPIGTDAVTSKQDVDRELIVMVVGETARADRFAINGYERPTNPMLEQENVVSFTHVTSCGTSTVVSLPCMFALGGREDDDGGADGPMENALDVLAHAGVTVLWRDNNSDSKGVSKRVRTEDFRSKALNPMCDIECRDEGMLADLQDYIDQHPEGDLLIVLHQMGSHGPAYYKRYPAAFRQFTPTCDTAELENCTREEINNSYDNTILYTDYFLSRVINLLRTNDERFDAAMFYVSDHGESLGESGMYLHGAPYFIAPKAQTHVPMILWFGDHYDDASLAAMGGLRHAPLSHDFVFHTLLGFFEIDSRVYQPGRDLLQKSRVLAGSENQVLLQPDAVSRGPG